MSESSEKKWVYVPPQEKAAIQQAWVELLVEITLDPPHTPLAAERVGFDPRLN